MPRPMRGLWLRVTLILLSSLLLVALVGLGAFYMQRRADVGESSLRFPLPDQVAAIAELVEATPLAQRPRLLRALNSTELRVALADGPLRRSGAAEADFPLATSLTERYLAELGPRGASIDVAGAGTPETRSRWSALFGENGLRGGRPLRIQIALAGNQVLMVEARGALLQSLIGRSVAFVSLLLIVLITVLSIWLLRRLIRPLEALAHEVERFGTPDEGGTLAVSGAHEVLLLVSAFERMRGRIHHLIEARSRLLADISHDLGTYLTRLRLRVDYLEDPVQRGRAEQDLHDMQRLLRDALALAQTDHALQTREPVDLLALAQRTVRDYQEMGAHASLSTTVPAFALGQPAALQRVLINLVDNAVKHGGGAELRLRHIGSQVELCVEDRGPGIPAGERERVLEPFYRPDRARNLERGGSGLGLAIVAGLVRSHGGELVLEDRTGGGLRARVMLAAVASA